ncbi:glycosyltransferase family 4 protein [Telmatobacter sp. DSM 110680]|uniref:Glycosyltransferase family 4 protein n=1 Tax=Telmatobacter sp. DSM 110680 TaxID=3036704 RepID=A0AAU7DHF8_9BACT
MNLDSENAVSARNLKMLRSQLQARANYTMNILLINHYAGSPRHGMEYRPFYMSREWVRLGHHVTIIASSFSHVRTHQPSVNSWKTEEVLEGINYIWLKAPQYTGNGARRILNMLVFVLQLLRLRGRIRRREKPDVVIASSTYPLDIFPAFLLARGSKCRLVFEVHDLWPLSPMKLGGFSKWHPFIMAMQFAEDFAYRRADTVVSMLPCARPYMKSRGLDEQNFVYVPNGVLICDEEPTGVDSENPYVLALRKLREEGRFLILYAGAHGVANALDSFLDAAQLLSDCPVTFVLIGQGPEKENLQRKCASLNLSNVAFLSSITRASIIEVLREADVLYISLQRNPLFRFGISPNKLFDYMLAGRPIIQAIDAGNDIVGESGCGLTIAPEDPQALVCAIQHFMAMGEMERQSLGENGRSYVRSRHDYRKLAELFPLAANSIRPLAFRG